jgi:hypothetical protein
MFVEQYNFETTRQNAPKPKYIVPIEKTEHQPEWN